MFCLPACESHLLSFYLFKKAKLAYRRHKYKIISLLYSDYACLEYWNGICPTWSISWASTTNWVRHVCIGRLPSRLLLAWVILGRLIAKPSGKIDFLFQRISDHVCVSVSIWSANAGQRILKKEMEHKKKQFKAIWRQKDGVGSIQADSHKSASKFSSGGAWRVMTE